MLKKISKGIIVSVLWWFVSRYQKKFDPIVIGVVGSVGKTGTKRAIAKVLESEKTVAWQDGNYNDIVTVPLVYFGLTEPSLFNPFAWVKVIFKMISALSKPKGVDVVVLELGTDAPGQIGAFNNRLKLDYGVVTAISHEHMENFDDLDSVAKEEFAIAEYTRQLYVHRQVEKDGFTKQLVEYETYGGVSGSESNFTYQDNQLIVETGRDIYKIKTLLIGEHQYDALVIAILIAEKLELSKDKIKSAVQAIKPMSGRMQSLRGKDGSLIIDDTYNSSPNAVKAALDYVYASEIKRKIVILGNMNEMGQISKELHQDVGEYCDPKKIKLLITLGKDANKYIASSAEKKGCKVVRMENPKLIGEYLADMELSNTIILFKGSQNGVFLEEAIKPILKDKADSVMLVRQSEYWMDQKAKQFEGLS